MAGVVSLICPQLVGSEAGIESLVTFRSLLVALEKFLALVHALMGVTIQESG